MAIKAKNTITLVRTDDGLPAYVHNAWANSPDGTVDFTTVYPGENLYSKSNLTKIIFTGGAYGGGSGNYTGAILPVSAGKTYTITSHDHQQHDRFGLFFTLEKPAYYMPNTVINRTNGTKPMTWTATEDGYLGIQLAQSITGVPENIRLKVELGDQSTIYTPSPADDPVNCHPKYMGTCSNHSETAPTDPSEYHWEVDPTYLKYVTDGKVDQGNFDEGLENIYDVLGSKTDAEDFKNLQEQAKSLQDSYKSFTSEGGQYETDLANLESRATNLYLELGDKLLGLAFINTWFKVGEEGLAIGSDNSSVKMLLSNNQLSFVDAGQTVAYFTSQSFYINRGVIALSFQVGSHKITKIDNDYTVFQWVG